MKKYLIYVIDIYKLEYLKFIYLNLVFFLCEILIFWDFKNISKRKNDILNRVVYI